MQDKRRQCMLIDGRSRGRESNRCGRRDEAFALAPSRVSGTTSANASSFLGSYCALCGWTATTTHVARYLRATRNTSAVVTASSRFGSSASNA